MNMQLGSSVSFEVFFARLLALRDWLGAELRVLLPVESPKFVSDLFQRRVLTVEGREWRLGSRQDSEDCISLNLEDTDAERRDLIARLDPAALHHRVAMAIPVTDGFMRHIHLPGAAEERLREVVSFQIDRLSPLRAKDVAFDCVKTAREDDGSIEVLVGIVPKATLQAYERRLRGMDLAVDRFVLAETGLKFKPVDKSWTNQERLRFALGTVAAVALATAILLTPALRGDELARLSAQTSALRAPAAEAQGTRNMLLGMQSAVAAASEESSRPSPLDTLRFLTALLPDDVQLTDLTIERDSVRLIGSAPRAKDVLQLLSRSRKFKGAHFVDPIASQPAGRELFQIEAQLMLGQPK